MPELSEFISYNPDEKQDISLLCLAVFRVAIVHLHESYWS